MTGTNRTSHGLDPRRRRALYRAWHRGLKEMDLILGRFTDAEIGTMSGPEFDDFERLLEMPDVDLYDWVTGRNEVPPEFDTVIFRRLRAFRSLPET